MSTARSSGSTSTRSAGSFDRLRTFRAGRFALLLTPLVLAVVMLTPIRRCESRAAGPRGRRPPAVPPAAPRQDGELA